MSGVHGKPDSNLKKKRENVYMKKTDEKYSAHRVCPPSRRKCIFCIQIGIA